MVRGGWPFIVGALEYERLFLAHLYAFLSKIGGPGLVALPLYVRLVFFHLASCFNLRRHDPPVEKRITANDGFRVDTRAFGEEIGIGGWQPMRDKHGAIDTGRSHCFACTLNRDSAPWAYHRRPALSGYSVFGSARHAFRCAFFRPELERSHGRTLVASSKRDGQPR